ncbi:MAG: hypothetical protein DRN33_03000 [Thermoplasmata archaeon]|nr:MAG: hypothetical protein DRN33_03000 [Thermoplasmata archaeon]
MTRRKLRYYNPSRFRRSRFKNFYFSLQDFQLKTVRVTIYALRWVFFLIFVFIAVGIIALFLTGGQNYVQIIVGYSIAGFFTFFMGYFGWILAQGMIELLTGDIGDDEIARGFSYYLKKRSKKYKYRQ